MEPDAIALAEFYDSRLGQMARRLVLRRLKEHWADVRGLRLLGYGFATPYLRAFLGEAERAVAAMPAAIGPPDGYRLGSSGRRLAVLTEEDALPFPDAMFDRVLVVHGLEGAEALRPLLRQLWRVTAPEGRLLVVAPNRASLWAQVERSPFGYGRPFSRGELNDILRGAMFVPEQWGRALYAPPLQSLVGRGTAWERLGARFFPGLGGVHIVSAGKSLYAPVGPTPLAVGARAQRLSAAGTE